MGNAVAVYDYAWQSGWFCCLKIDNLYSNLIFFVSVNKRTPPKGGGWATTALAGVGREG